MNQHRLYWRRARTDQPEAWGLVLEEEHLALASNRRMRKARLNELLQTRNLFEQHRGPVLLARVDRVAQSMQLVAAGLAPGDALLNEVQGMRNQMDQVRANYGLLQENAGAAEAAWMAMDTLVVQGMLLLRQCRERGRFQWFFWQRKGPWVREMKGLIADLGWLIRVFRSEDGWMSLLVHLLHDARRCALCLSGGGIRSASFALGVLQGLARKGLLPSFDYLSTVSGGGYTGGWLVAWLHRQIHHQNGVIEELKKHNPVWTPAKLLANGRDRFAHGPEPTPEPRPVWWIRSYSRYLSPRLYPFSGDLWALVAAVIRNIALNGLVLIPILFALLTVPQLLLAWRTLGGPSLAQALLTAGTALVMISFVLALDGLPSRTEAMEVPFQPRFQDWSKAKLKVRLSVGFQLIGAFLVSWAVTHPAFWKLDQHSPWFWAPFFVLALVLSYINVAGRQIHGLFRRKILKSYPALLTVGFIAVLCLRWFGRGMTSFSPEIFALLFATFMAPFVTMLARREEFRKILPMLLFTLGLWGLWVVTIKMISLHLDIITSQRGLLFGFPVAILVVFAAQVLTVGPSSSREWITTLDREWFARFGGYLLMAACGWLLFAGISIYGKSTLDFLTSRVPKTFATITGVALPTAIWGMLTSAGHDSNKASGFKRFMADRVAPLGGFAGILALLLFLAVGLNGCLGHFAPGFPAGVFPALVLLGALALGFLFGWIVPLNKFSLHELYRNRLIRAFLAASRPVRFPDPLTGFDKRDDIPMHRLRKSFRCRRGKLFPVINLTLNAVYGDKLGWQDRKGRPFTVTPIHCGSPYMGFRRTRRYGDKISLATAVTISGAAMNPCMGYHSSTMLSALMTFLSVRLGVWLGNPGLAGSHRAWGGRPAYCLGSPPFFLRVLLREVLGMTRPDYTYVNLSDGGHFENLGLYAMVARRCRVIVVSDASADPHFTFDDLGRVIRLIRIDQGISIVFKDGGPKIWPAKDNKKRGGSGAYLSVAEIRYSDVDEGAPNGLLVYIKPVLLNTEPADVSAYACTCPDFPHESTMDQFFSESQFESYRELGCHAIERSTPASFGGVNLHRWVEVLPR